MSLEGWDFDETFRDPEAVHVCDERKSHRAAESWHEGVDPAYGIAVEKVLAVNGSWWAVSRGAEYATQVSFCPWCGVRLSTSGLMDSMVADVLARPAQPRPTPSLFSPLSRAEAAGGILSRDEEEGDRILEFPKGEPLLWQHEDRVSGAVCLHGSRLTVTTPLSLVADGVSLKEIAEDYPTASPSVMRRLLRFCAVMIDPSANL